MGITRLENRDIIIEVDSLGAELQKIYSKRQKKDYLWEGDSRYWNKRSPILFPIVGQLKEDEIEIEGGIYKLTRHGFARDCEFKLIEQNEDSLMYLLEPNDYTRGMYPYDFILYINYKLIDHVTSEKSIIEVEWTVINKDTRDMYFSIGAHPAFRIPHKNKDELKKYKLLLQGEDELREYIMNPPYIKEEKNVFKQEELNIDRDLFVNDTLIYKGLNKVTLLNSMDNSRITIDFPGFPYVAIWSKVTPGSGEIAPFICIEPWYGISDYDDSVGRIEKKQGIERLKPNEKFLSKYFIEIN